MHKVVVFTAVATVCLMAGCAPRTFEDCKSEAAKSPTPQGVQVAVQACFEKFEKPRLAAEHEIAKKRSEEVAKQWRFVQGSRTMESVESLVGKPDNSAPYACAAFKEGEKPPEKCILYFWKDARTPAACVHRKLVLPPIYEDGLCRWKVQARPDGVVWATWDDPD